MSRQNIVPNTPILPANYQLHGTMDLKKDKKINIGIQVTFILVVVCMIGLAKWLNFPTESNWGTGIRILATVLMGVVYMIVHELTHGVFMKLFSKVKPVYFVRFPFLCTGSAAYFNKKNFIIIALAPVVLWGAFLIAMLTVHPSDFFLSVYIIIGLNFAGAAGDYF
ncbi:MAG: DUF3267 domain-containing protein [Christensenellales bacterium]|jgi:hypothetical protein